MPLRKGDRVILISNIYGCASNNPVWESDHACVGTVRDSGESFNVRVDWDNGYSNVYDHKYLDIYAENGETWRKSNNPNRAFRLERARKDRARRRKGGVSWDEMPLPK